MSASILIIGEGLLANRVYEELSVQYEITQYTDFDRKIPATTDLVLVLHDTWNPSFHKQAESVLQSTNIPWLRAFVSFGEGIIGPLVRPGTPGCSECADIRRTFAGNDSKEMWGIMQILTTNKEIPRDIWASSNGLLQMTHLLLEEVQCILQGDHARSEGHMFFVNLQTLKSSYHFFLPHPLCSNCSQLPNDSSHSAKISLQSSPKISINDYRCRSISELSKVLAKDYLDYETGFLNDKMYNLTPPFAEVSVNLPLLFGNEGTAGRTHSYATSELTAILEGLERYCGLEPRGKRTVIQDTFRNLAHQALNPLEVGVHATEQYMQPNFPFKPFHPDRPMNWVWGYSLLQERPILVPELLAYYSLGGRDGFVYETSNGCALGGSLEEAIFYGILEVIERDSFLLTWYAELPLPRLDLSSVNDQELQLMVERVHTVGGYDIHLFNSTMEHGIPSVWALAKNRKEKGLNIICAAGAHLDPIRGAKSAIYELAGMMLTLDKEFEMNRKKYVQMFHNPSLVKQMPDHPKVCGLPEAEERFQFLLDNNRPLQTFTEAFKQKTRHEDLTDDLREIIQMLHQLNLDVIVVDQTTPEIMRNGLHCVKVLIPGMLPMTFGHHLARLTGLERVLRVPMELGYTKQPLSFEQLNPHPHPFA
ncbi:MULTISPECIES: TOMM precursor leader peptide-binding protein [unclassified Bacillus (in: firmicutes)]|uniref:TOMM precursor leader peptide-binding protein n=1 Tax=unclassified Bacillus (in: firmicutes) TaxID=185979 RepID=UPI0008E9F318|nr:MULTISPECIES: TOMM precursor leader peptide-binding protein [unclassified Bacillus (in: firmicutes)]SFI74893.1 ribosomal protein S12 methylthiotransferase accessory factor [Bacillus sp. 71mf]SFS87779.1 ribosomal protein S12 methylthiotransferase accessory factor [Bacillus sp. 103mf]